MDDASAASTTSLSRCSATRWAKRSAAISSRNSLTENRSGWLMFQHRTLGHAPSLTIAISSRVLICKSREICRRLGEGGRRRINPLPPSSWHLSVTERQIALPPTQTGSTAVHKQRRRLKQLKSLEERLAEDAKRLREEAKLLPRGAMRDTTLRKARQDRLTYERVAALSRPAATKVGPIGN
jgi:hypothetical protein